MFAVFCYVTLTTDAKTDKKSPIVTDKVCIGYPGIAKNCCQSSITDSNMFANFRFILILKLVAKMKVVLLLDSLETSYQKLSRTLSSLLRAME